MTLFATILTLKGRDTQRINTWHPPAEFTPLSPFFLFRLINSTASFQNEPYTWLCMKSSKRHWLHLQIAQLQKLGKASISRIYGVFLVFTEAQLCFFSILKSNMTQQVKYSSTGWFVLLLFHPPQVLRQGQELCLLENFIDNCLVPTHKTALEPQKKVSKQSRQLRKEVFLLSHSKEKNSA